MGPFGGAILAGNEPRRSPDIGSAGSSYEAFNLSMGNGDLLCLYSDGITECESPEEEEYGLDRLRELLCKHRELPLGDLLAKIEQETTVFAAGQPQGDDQTVVLLRRRD